MTRIKRGDLFTIPVSDELVGIGQIVLVRGVDLLIVVFKGTIPADRVDQSAVMDAVNSETLLMGYTLDALLWNKHWKVVGKHVDNLDTIELPAFKLGMAGERMQLIDHAGEPVRSCTLAEFNSLNYFTTQAPYPFELALKSFWGIGGWEPWYDELLVDNFLHGKRALVGRLGA